MREYHHIDASVYLKAIDDPSLAFHYLNRLGRTFRCGVSVIILGEITKRLTEIFGRTNKAWMMLFLLSATS